MLIGLTGRAGSGKETAAAYLAQAHRFMPLAFDTPIRQMLQIGLGLTDQDFAPANKNEVITRLQRSPQQLAQTLGAEWGRTHVNSSIWIDLAAGELARMENLDVAFTDVTSEDRARMIRDRGGFIVRMVRSRVGPAPTHVPEAGVRLCEGDKEIHNNGTLFQLYDKLDALVGEEQFLGAVL